MHECGWVHRDISIGNILVDSAGRARLSDLEYAQKMDESDPMDDRVVCSDML